MENSMLLHYGIKGMKWGVRRYQNKDGTLTAAGEKRYDRDKRENAARRRKTALTSLIQTPSAGRRRIWSVPNERLIPVQIW